MPSKVPDEGKRSSGGKGTAALFTLAGTVVTTIGAIATNKTTPAAIVFGAIAAILFVFTALLAFQWRSAREAGMGDGTKRSKVKLEPDRLAKSLTQDQKTGVELALQGAVTDVATAVQVPDNLVRANLFARIPNTNKLAMVMGLWHHMDLRKEHTIRIEIGRGSTGNAWARQAASLVVWKNGWGVADIGNNKELKKVHPDLRWIISVPVFAGMEPVLVLNVDGLEQTPSQARLQEGLCAMLRFGAGISSLLGL